ncbi:Uncharacterised protein [Achromobacter kerstersii]|nr:Uncharacterised protein [Achromobacter kerstersii]
MLPRGEHAAGAANRQGRAQHVGVGLEAVHEAVGAELVAERGAGGQVLADEPAVGGAAIGGGQLHDFQVIRHAQRVLARRGVAVDGGAAVGTVQLVVRQRNVQRALHIAQASGDAARVVGGAEARLISSRVVGVERVADAEFKSVHRRGAVHDHVVPAHGVGRAETQAQVGLGVAGVEGIDVGQVVRADRGLAAEVQLAPGVVGQADGGLAAEQAARLSALAVGGVEPAFQLEDGAQAVAQIFGTTHAPAGAGLDAVDHAELATTVAIALDLVVAEAGVDDTIEGD